MKCCLLIPLFALFCWQPVKAQARPTVINFTAAIVKCPTGSPAFVMWTGSNFACVTLGSGLTLSGGALNAAPAAPYTPLWQTEPISLAAVAPGATTLTYTTAKTPLSAIWFAYASTEFFLSNSGMVPYTGQALTITLPIGWTASDTLTVTYQSQ